MRFCLLALFFAASTFALPRRAHADSEGTKVEKLSLDRALKQAVTGNLQLRHAEAEVRSSGGLLLSAQGLYDLELEIGGTFARKVTPRLADDDLTGGVSDQNGYRLELGRRLETGGRLVLGFNGAVATSNSPFECGSILAADRCVIHSAGGSIEFTQPLLRGFGPGVTSAEIRRHGIQRDIATLSRMASASVVVRDIVIAYAQLGFAHDVLAIQRSSLGLAREQLRNTEKQVIVGKRPPIDVAAAEQAVSATELLALEAEEDIFSRTLALRELLGLENPVPVTLLGTDDPAGPAAPPPLDEAVLVERAMAGNLQLQALRMGRKLSDVDLAIAQSLLLPRLDLEASVATIGRSGQIGPAFTQAGALQNTAWFAGLTFALPLQNRTARGQMNSARALREGIEITVESEAREIRNQVLRLVNALRSGSRRIEFAKKTVAFAETNLRAEKSRFGLGQSTNNDVLRVQQDLKQAQLTAVSAILELAVNQATLTALTGEILQQHGVVLRGLD